jgi:hypothetical protein
MALNTTFTSGQILTAAQMNNLPWGIAGSSTLATTNNFTSVEDSGLTVTWNAVSTRQYKITFRAVNEQSVASLVQYFITDSANVELQRSQFNTTAVNEQTTIQSYALVTGLSGSVTYKIRVACGAGTGIIYGTSTSAFLAARMLVEDIGAA